MACAVVGVGQSAPSPSEGKKLMIRYVCMNHDGDTARRSIGS